MKRFFPIFLVLFLISQIAFAQEMVFQNISPSIALPSQECYGVIQDKKGYIWISTELGLCRLGGNTIKVFDKKNDLEEGAAYAMTMDDKGKLWFASSKNRILTEQNGNLIAHPISKELQAQIGQMEVSYSLGFDEQNLYINASKNSFRLSLKSGLLHKIGAKPNDSLLFKLTDKNLISLNNSFAQFLPQYNVGIQTKTGKHTFKLFFTHFTDLFRYRIITAKTKKAAYFAFMAKIIKINADMSINVYQMPNAIISLYVDHEDGLWVGTFKSGIRYYEKANLDQQPILSLKNYSVSGICQDSEKNIWCTTLERGTFLAKNKQVISFTNIARLARPMQFIPYKKGMTFVMHYELQPNLSIKLRPEVDSQRTLSPLLKFDRKLLVTSGNGIKLLGSIAGSQKLTNRYDRFVYESDIGPDGTTYHIAYSHILAVKDGIGRILLKLKSPGRNVLAVDNYTIVYGCLDGLFKFDLRTKEITRVSNINYHITKILKVGNGEVWVSTKGNGLFKLHKNGVIKLNKELGIATDVLYDMAIDSVGNVWIGSNQGLIKINKQEKHISTKIYTVLNGLAANEIYKVALINHQLFLSTPEGLSKFPLTENLSNQTPPPIYLNILRVNNQLFDEQQLKKELNYNQNSLSVDFDVLSFKNKIIRLKYRLNDTEPFISTTGNALDFKNLNPNHYELTVYGVNSDGVTSTVPVVLKFDIAAPFWQKAWFILLAILLFVLLVFVSVSLLIKNVRRKEREKTRINMLVAESKLTALQAQMNPHFVFNAINSIQNYILKKQEKEAYAYLAKFSKLIRLVLHNSQEQTISLFEELETLKLYVLLEQLRFKNSFDFTINLNSEIDEHLTSVPTLLIQPYLENAIWHGLMNLEDERKGFLTLNIMKDEHHLRIEIIDNGVGRERAMAYKAAGYHQPVALKINEQRLTAYNELFGKGDFRAIITDLYENNIAFGTMVTLYLPLNL